MSEAIQAHWNERAMLGAIAGTQDVIASVLGRRALLEEMATLVPSMVLEIGCGIGETARCVVKQFPGVDLLAVDNAAAMIRAAKARPHPASRLRFQVADVADLPHGYFDCIYTQRMLINLSTWDEQQQALQAIAERLVSGGRYLMLENSQDGLDAINKTRAALALPAISPPWHNRYFQDDELAEVTCLKLIRCIPFSATYYFLSRIVNAKLAQQRGEEPAYDAPINQLAMKLPPVGPWAQGRLWVWEKRSPVRKAAGCGRNSAAT